MIKKLYPNGNVNRDFSHENSTIEYKKNYGEQNEDYCTRIMKYFDYSTRNHWLERSYTNYKAGIPNPIYSTVIAENDTMLLMSINKCFTPGTVSIASKKFHLSPLEYDEKEKKDFFEMLTKVTSFLEKKFKFKPLISEHAANQYEHIKRELVKFIEIVPDSHKEQVFTTLANAWSNIIKGDSGIHSHTLVIPCKLPEESIIKSKQEMGLKQINGYEEFFKQDISKKYDYFIVGSDQVWNPIFNHLTDKELLTEISPQKRISYAASFGISELPNEYHKKVRRELNKFKAMIAHASASARA